MVDKLSHTPDPVPPLRESTTVEAVAPISSTTMHASGAVPYIAPKTPARRLVKATPADLKFVDSLQKKYGRSLGFLPTPALQANLEAGNITLTRENEDAAGYLLVRPVLSWQPALASIVQAAVCMDAQRRHHGLALLLQIEHEARGRGQIALQANCAIGVEANEFWQAAGFKPIAHMTPKTKSGREIICWRKPLKRSLPMWFTELPAKSGHLARAPLSVRNVTRSGKTQAFAERFVAGKVLAQGDPAAAESGIITSTSELGQSIINGVC
jgi:N-acetylglutamate synthase-like GNAT family acetyltransferase